MSALVPPENITVSEWAEKYRQLDAKTTARPGPWRNSSTPYLKGLMDEFNNYETEHDRIRDRRRSVTGDGRLSYR